MNMRKTFLALSVAALATPAAFADNFVGGEQGYETHPVAGKITRAQVQQEYLAFRAHPVLADGTVMLQGELGYVSPMQGAFADRVPSEPHTHVLGNTTVVPVKNTSLRDAERRAVREQYLN